MPEDIEPRDAPAGITSPELSGKCSTAAPVIPVTFFAAPSVYCKKPERGATFLSEKPIMLMTTESRGPAGRGVSNIFDSFNNPDFVAVCVVAIIGLLMTILMAQIFPLDKAIDLLLMSG